MTIVETPEPFGSKSLPDGNHPDATSGTISTPKTDRLTRCEETIERGTKWFYEVGAALAEIRDDKLYRRDYKTFEEYCSSRWSMSRPQAYRLIDASNVVNNLSPMGDIFANERQVRPLVALPPEKQREAYATACKRTGGRPTEKVVREVVAEMRPKPGRSPQPVSPPLRTVSLLEAITGNATLPPGCRSFEKFCKDEDQREAERHASTSSVSERPTTNPSVASPAAETGIEIEVSAPATTSTVVMTSQPSPDTEDNMPFDPERRIVSELMKAWMIIRNLAPFIKSEGGWDALSGRLDAASRDTVLNIGKMLCKSGESIVTTLERS